MSTGGATPSTLSDVIRYVIALYARPEVTPAHVVGDTYAIGDQVSADGRVYTCHAAGVAAEAPSGIGTYSDANGVGWFALFYTEETWENEYQQGAPPRIYFKRVKANPGIGPVLEISSRQIGSFGEGIRAYIWGAEESEDGEQDRYDFAMAMAKRLYAAFNAAGCGRLSLNAFEPDPDEPDLSFGAQYILEVAFTWEVPRDDAIDAAAKALADLGAVSESPLDPDRPDGGNGSTYGINVVMENNRT